MVSGYVTNKFWWQKQCLTFFERWGVWCTLAWGQPRSVTSGDLWKFNMQCQRSHVVTRWPKSCIISPFLLMTTICVAENTISSKNRSESVPVMTSYDHISLTWPDQLIFPKVAQRMTHKLCKISARSAHWFGNHFRKKIMGRGWHQPTPCTGKDLITDLTKTWFYDLMWTILSFYGTTS